jgi:hypothetical protein
MQRSCVLLLKPKFITSLPEVREIGNLYRLWFLRGMYLLPVAAPPRKAPPGDTSPSFYHRLRQEKFHKNEKNHSLLNGGATHPSTKETVSLYIQNNMDQLSQQNYLCPTVF